MSGKLDDLAFIQVGELAKGISEDTLPEVRDLSGTSLSLFAEDGSLTGLAFSGAHELSWEVLEGPEAGTRGEETCRVTRPREGIFFVDYISRAKRATSVSLVLDVGGESATAVIGTLPTEAEVSKGAYWLATAGSDLTAVGVEFLRASVDKPFVLADYLHAPTSALVGKRVQYVYSQTEKYEHIYLNDKLYTWQCLEGSEKGLADTDRCHCYEVADELYLFVWREKVVPTLGVVLVDWLRMRSTGKLFGYESSDFGALSNTPIASAATLLNVTTYA